MTFSTVAVRLGHSIVCVSVSCSHGNVHLVLNCEALWPNLDKALSKCSVLVLLLFLVRSNIVQDVLYCSVHNALFIKIITAYDNYSPQAQISQISSTVLKKEKKRRKTKSRVSAL